MVDFTFLYSTNDTVRVIDDELLNKFYDAGCDDCVIGFGKESVIAFEFSTDETDIRKYIEQKRICIETVIPLATLFEVTPDMVNLSDIARLFGCSRQNIHKNMAKHDTFPNPITSSDTSIWRLYEVVKWVKSKRLLTYSTLPSNTILEELAFTTASINLKIQLDRLKR